MEQTSNNTQEYRERFKRWQMKTLEERGKFISLLLTLSLATIAFVVNQLLKTDFAFKCWNSKYLLIVGLPIIFICVCLCLWLSMNRLKDLRQTTAILKARKDNESQENIKILKDENDKIGKNTISIMNLMVATFIIGEILSIAAFVIELIS